LLAKLNYFLVVVSFFVVSIAIFEESAAILLESALILDESAAVLVESALAFSAELLQEAIAPIAAIAITNINFFICDCFLTLN